MYPDNVVFVIEYITEGYFVDAIFIHMKEDNMRNGQLKPGYNAHKRKEIKMEYRL